MGVKEKASLYLTRILGNRQFQVAAILFLLGFTLAVVANHVTTETTIEEDTIGPEEDGAQRDIYYPDERREWYLHPAGLGVDNATLELKGENEETVVTVQILRSEEIIENITVDGFENRTEDLTGRSPTHLIFDVEKGNLTYTYTLTETVMPYRSLSIPAFICLVSSLFFFFWAVSSISFAKVEEDEKKKLDKDQEVVNKILEERDDDK